MLVLWISQIPRLVAKLIKEVVMHWLFWKTSKEADIHLWSGTPRVNISSHVGPGCCILFVCLREFVWKPSATLQTDGIDHERSWFAALQQTRCAFMCVYVCVTEQESKWVEGARDRDKACWSRRRHRWLRPAETGNRGDTRWTASSRMKRMHERSQVSSEAANPS